MIIAKNEERSIPWSQQVDEVTSYENLTSPINEDSPGNYLKQTLIVVLNEKNRFLLQLPIKALQHNSNIHLSMLKRIKTHHGITTSHVNRLLILVSNVNLRASGIYIYIYIYFVAFVANIFEMIFRLCRIGP